MQPRAGAAVSQETPAGEATWGVAPGRSQARAGERSGTDNQRSAPSQLIAVILPPRGLAPPPCTANPSR